MVVPSPGKAVIPWNTLADTPYVPSSRQVEFHESPARYKLYGGAVGGGKTTALAIEALLLSWDTPNNEGIVGRRDFDDLRRTTYAEVLKWCPDELIKQHHKSEHWLELINGSVIHFMELKDAGGLKNMNLGWFAIDQAEEVPYESFLWLQSRLRRVGVPDYYGLLSANPEPGWVKDLFVTARSSGHVFVPALPADNPYLPGDYVAGLLERWPETYVRKLLLGSWDVVENAIYPQLDRASHVRSLPQSIRWEEGAIGVDYGEVHPSAVYVITRDSLGYTWVREGWAAPTVSDDDYESLWATINRFRKDYNVPLHRVGVDPMLKGWDKQYGIRRSDGSPGSRKARIQMVTTLLNGKVTRPGVPRTPSLLFDQDGPGIRELIEQMATYRWEKSESDFAEEMKPVRKDDDRVAALEYAVETLETAGVPIASTAPLRSHRTNGRRPGYVPA